MTAKQSRGANGKRLSDLDKALGAEVRRLRILKGWSQDRLGKAIKLTFQQVQKYERGTNVMSPSRLVDICHVLEVDAPAMLAKIMSDLKNTRHPANAALPADRDVLELVTAYQSIRRAKTREFCRLAVRQIAELSNTA